MGAIEIPPPLREALEERVRHHRVPLAQQVAALRELFDLFTQKRRELPRLSYLDTPRHRLAYLRYHLPLNVARTLCVLRDLLAVRPDLTEVETVVDLGAGPGSSSLATFLELPPRRRRLILTDRSRGGLRLARELLEDVARRTGAEPPEIQTRVQKLPEVPEVPPRSLVFLTMVLNELHPAPRHGLDLDQVVRRLGGRLGAGSVLVVIEPALRGAGLRLISVRDALAASRGWRVLAPCTHEAPCPLLRLAGRPWCHFHLAWKGGRLVEEVAAPLGLSSEKAALSYLVAEREADRAAEAPHRPREPEPGIGRVIGDPMDVRGGRGIYICREGRRDAVQIEPATVTRGDIAVGARSPQDRPLRLVRHWPGARDPNEQETEQRREGRSAPESASARRRGRGGPRA